MARGRAMRFYNAALKHTRKRDIMEKEKKSVDVLRIAAGIMFAALTVIGLISIVQNLGYYYDKMSDGELIYALISIVYNLAIVIGRALLAAALLGKGSKSKSGLGFALIAAGFGLYILYLLYLMIRHFVDTWFYYSAVVPSTSLLLGYIARAAAYVTAGALAFSKRKSGAAGLLPVILAVVSLWLFDFVFLSRKLSAVSCLLELTALLCAGLWLAGAQSKGEAQRGGAEPRDSDRSYQNKETGESHRKTAPFGASCLPRKAYFGMFGHVMLLLFTLGIWYLIWIYRSTKYLNADESEEPRNPTTKLLLCMFIPFYIIYWTYKSAQRADRLCSGTGMTSDITTVCLILAIFIPIVPPILIQDKINKLSGGESQRPQPQYQQRPQTVEARPQAQRQSERRHTPETQAAPPKRPAVDDSTVIELQAYKELLDMGLVTKEEFERKKRELLNL